MAPPRLSTEMMQQAIDALSQYGNQAKAAAALGISRATLQGRLHAASLNRIERAEYALDVPIEEIDLPALVANRKAAYSRKARVEEAAHLQTLRIKLDGPIGILHLGDPHVDDNGTDLGLLEGHCAIVRKTPGLFSASIGDTTNNWIGRLAKLYGEQSTSAAEAWALAEWLFDLLGEKLIYVVGGNHDLWSGAGDPLKWIARRSGAGMYAPSQVRLNLKFPAGIDVRINARHDFKGHSQYNPAHGVGKALLHGVRDHMAICGHKHTSGYTVLKDPDTGMIGHGIQIASYKIYDRYAKEHGFRDQHISPCAVTIINPTAAHDADVIQVFWNPETAADYLTWLRGRK